MQRQVLSCEFYNDRVFSNTISLRIKTNFHDAIFCMVILRIYCICLYRAHSQNGSEVYTLNVREYGGRREAHSGCRAKPWWGPMGEAPGKLLGFTNVFSQFPAKFKKSYATCTYLFFSKYVALKKKFPSVR